jgi:uncharacterized protein YbaR (Trm112 family)
MDISFSCADCGQQLMVDESGAGLTVRCPKCDQNLTIPSPRAANGAFGTAQPSAGVNAGRRIKGQDLFHISLDGNIKGPLTLHEFAALYYKGGFQSATVYSKNCGHWQPISEIIPLLKYADQDLFHISLGGNVKGPLTLHDFAALYYKGAFPSDTLYSKNDSEHWRPISDIVPMLKLAQSAPARAPAASTVGRTDSPEPSAASRNEPAGPGPGILDKLLKATEANDYDNFVADGTDVFKAGITKQMLQGVSDQISTRMKKGYECAYLGELSQQGRRVLLSKLVFKDGGDDTLAKLVLKDGKVAGFWLQ